MADDQSSLRLLYDLGCAFAARIELDDLIPHVIKNCCETFAAEGASLLLLDGEANELCFPYAAGTSPDVESRLARLRFPADRGIAGTVLQSGRGVRIDDVQSDARFYADVDRATGLTTRALLCAPLATSRGTLGVIQVVNPRAGGRFSDDDLALLEALAGSIAVAIDNARLYARVKASEETLRAQVAVLRRDLARRDRFTEIVGASAAMGEVLRLMDSAATSPIAVLIEGETGTGKELVARGIHRASPRAEAPFVAVNCAALPEHLLESQLFGHRRGAFTGALQDQRGFFEAASGGTIFLDEVGDMPPPMQAKLLRVLQEGEVVAVGDVRPRPVDVRVISATNHDLGGAVAARGFRADLYYRTTAWRPFPFASRRSATAATTFPSWWLTCWAVPPSVTGRKFPGSNGRPWICWPPSTGGAGHIIANNVFENCGTPIEIIGGTSPTIANNTIKGLQPNTCASPFNCSEPQQDNFCEKVEIGSGAGIPVLPLDLNDPDRDKVKVNENTLTWCKFGILVKEGAEVVATDNIVKDGYVSAFRVDESGKLSGTGNKIKDTGWFTESSCRGAVVIENNVFAGSVDVDFSGKGTQESANRFCQGTLKDLRNLAGDSPCGDSGASSHQERATDNCFSDNAVDKEGPWATSGHTTGCQCNTF